MPDTSMTIPAIYQRIAARTTIQPSGCLYWTGAVSQSGWRGVFYPVMRVRGQYWRINRLLCCLAEADAYPVVVNLPEFLEYLNRLHRGDDASHTCDHASCVNGDHVIWQSHRLNIQDAAQRRRA